MSKNIEKKYSLARDMIPNSLDDSLPEIESALVSKRLPSETSKQLIASSLQKHYLFSSLSTDDMEILYGNLKFYSVAPDKVIFEQGALGKKFYIIESGKLEVYRSGVKKNVLKEGETFGEMAILTNSKRRAMIKTMESATLWGIGRDQFRAAIKIINSKTFDLHKRFISNLPIFEQLSDLQINLLTEATVEHSYPDNTRIICEGDEGMLLFIVKDGNAIAKIKGEEKFRIGTGELFGEAVVLGENLIRNISVYSVGEVRALSIARDSIISILGEDFKEAIYKTQAINCFNSDKYGTMLSKEIILNIVESMDWKFVKPGEVAIGHGALEENIFTLCLGSISTPTKTFCHFKVIGLNEKIYQTTDDFIANTETILGFCHVSKLENYTKVLWGDLKYDLKSMAFLSKINIFSGLNFSKLRYIASHSSLVEFDAKEIIYKHNDEGHEFYVIKRGGVDIISGGKLLRVLGRLDVFGDRCIEEPIRNNSAKAAMNCLCIVIKTCDFKDVMDDNMLKQLQKKTSFVSHFSLNQMLLVKLLPPEPPALVFLSYVQNIDKLFKVVVLDKNFFDSPDKFNKIVQEKNIAMQLDHHLAIRLITTFTDRIYVYLVFEHLDSSSFAGLLTRKLSEEVVKFIAACLISCLERLHYKDIIYRGLSPESILINQQGYFMIHKYQLAKRTRSRTYSVVGDPFYMAPEVNQGNGYTKTADMWSLGVLIHQMLYCSYPFNIKSKDLPMDIYTKITTENLVLPPDSKFIRGNEIITGLLKLEPKERLSIDQLKHSRWLDSIDWQNLNNASANPPVKIEVPNARLSIKLNKLTSLAKYVNVSTYIGKPQSFALSEKET